MPVINITRDMKRCGESRRAESNNKKARKVDLIDILRVQKQVRYSKILAKTSRDQCKENDPADHEHRITLHVIQKQLDRERVSEFRQQKVELAHIHNDTIS